MADSAGVLAVSVLSLKGGVGKTSVVLGLTGARAPVGCPRWSSTWTRRPMRRRSSIPPRCASLRATSSPTPGPGSWPRRFPGQRGDPAYRWRANRRSNIETTRRRQRPGAPAASRHEGHPRRRAGAGRLSTQPGRVVEERSRGEQPRTRGHRADDVLASPAPNKRWQRSTWCGAASTCGCGPRASS